MSKEVNRPNLLFLTFRYPYPSLRGDQVRARYFLEGLSEEFNVTLLYLSGEPLEGWRVKLLKKIKVKSKGALINFLGWGLSPLPFQTRLVAPKGLVTQVRELSRQHDLLFVQTVRLAPAILGAGAIPKVMDFQDAFSLNMKERAKVAPPFLKPIYLAEAALLNRYEEDVVRSVDLGFITAPLDWSVIGGYDKVKIIPNGVDIAYFQATRITEQRDDNSIMFLGRMSYPPNEDAVLYFTREVLPLIRRKKPNATFWVVGADPTSRVLKLKKIPGVYITGYVPDVRPFLLRSAVFVAPMRIGTGVQNKILEAMASKIPVVLSSKAAEPLGIQQRQQALIADDPASFADSVVEILESPPYAERLSESAFAWLVRNYSWSAVMAKVNRYLLNLLYNKPRRGK